MVMQDQKTLLINYIDNLVLAIIFMIAVLPFTQIFTPKLFDVNSLTALPILELLLIVILVFRIITSGKIYYGLPLFLFIFLVIFNFFYSVFVLDRDTAPFFQQLSYYLPFILSLFFLASGITFPVSRLLKILIIGGLISGLLALIIYLFFPLLIYGKLGTVGGTEGRLYWMNETLPFFQLLFLSYKMNVKNIEKVIYYFTFCVVLTAIVLTGSRTIIIGYLLFLFVSSFLKRKMFCKKSITGFLWLFLGLVAIIISLSVVYYIISASPESYQSFIRRFWGNTRGLYGVIQGAFINNRIFIYYSYLEQLKTSWLLGQGLGAPFHYSRIFKMNVMATDVSFIAFLLPFGIFGLTFLIYYLRLLYQLLLKCAEGLVKTNIKILFWIAIFMSLNQDIFTRQTFIIFFTIFILSIAKEKNFYVKSSIK
jgi:hypothetical protein